MDTHSLSNTAMIFDQIFHLQLFYRSFWLPADFRIHMFLSMLFSDDSCMQWHFLRTVFFECYFPPYFIFAGLHCTFSTKTQSPQNTKINYKGGWWGKTTAREQAADKANTSNTRFTTQPGLTAHAEQGTPSIPSTKFLASLLLKRKARVLQNLLEDLIPELHF